MSPSVHHATLSLYISSSVPITLLDFLLVPSTMPSDAVFRSSLVWLAALVVLIGVHTQSLKKMMATYLLGVFVIAGVLLPDWEFFDRDVSLWGSPISATRSSTGSRPPPPTRFRIYPVRLAIYTLVYGFAFYKWWMLVSN